MEVRFDPDALDELAGAIRLRRFPFAIVYRVSTDEIQVVAVAHLHRRPGYWRHRTSG